MSQLMRCEWTGEGFKPLGRSMNYANDTFVVGMVYAIEEYQPRDMKSHNFYFKWLKEAWQNLPEDVAGLYPSVEHLRKRALVQAGYFHEQVIDAGTKDAARRIAEGLQAREPFALVILRGPVAIIRIPESQALRAMGAQRFEDSKKAVMDIVAELIGVERSTLENQPEAP